LREFGMRGLGLNFAVMRSVLANEGGARISHRIERRMLGWLSDSMQIESLWKYNAKFDPDWYPRYAVYDAPENFLSSAVAVAKAESFWELPLVGRFFAPDEPAVSASEKNLHDDDVEPAPELATDLALGSDELEPGSAVQRDRRLVATDDPGHDRMEPVRGREPN
jgi:Phosphatidylglycerol lysyltransferase, C-terminal